MLKTIPTTTVSRYPEVLLFVAEQKLNRLAPKFRFLFFLCVISILPRAVRLFHKSTATSRPHAEIKYTGHLLTLKCTSCCPRLRRSLDVLHTTSLLCRSFGDLLISRNLSVLSGPIGGRAAGWYATSTTPLYDHHPSAVRGEWTGLSDIVNSGVSRL